MSAVAAQSIPAAAPPIAWQAKIPPVPPVPPSLDVEWPEKLVPLMEGYEEDGDRSKRRRYYVAYGGRGSAKSWTFARALLIQGLYDPLRILCAREVMRTIADSVHRLLKDQIAELGLQDWYSVTDTSITGINGTEFLFAGLRSLDAHKIKSYEGVDIVWVEEAQTVSKRSWEILIPTIRAEGSEIWVTFNPELDTDDTYTRFVEQNEPDVWLQYVTYRDNPWFPKVLEAEREKLKRRDPTEYEYVWEGKPRTVVVGAIYAGEVVKMIQDRRVRALPYDPRLPVHSIWDLGWNDQTSILFVQKVLSEVRLIDYEEESFLRLDQWAKRVKDKDYVYASHWLPHDGDHETQAANGLSARAILKPLLGKDPKIMPRVKDKEQMIRAARMVFPRTYIDRDKCARLLTCLKRYRRAIPQSTGEEGSPVHDEYSHGADTYGGLAIVVEQLTNEGEFNPKSIKVPVRRQTPGMGM